MVSFSLESIASRICGAAVALAIGCSAPLAQSVVIPPDTTGEFLQEAFSTPYGRMMISEFSVKAGDGADRACLRNKGTVGEYFAQGEGFLRGWGVLVLGNFYSIIGNKTYDDTVEEVLGPNAQEKLKEVLAAPEVVRYREIERPGRQIDALYFVLELLDRYVLIENLNLRPVSPLATGVQALLDASGAEKIQDALFEFQDANKTQALEQYVQIADRAREALNAALKDERVSATRLFKMADQDLAGLCIFRKTPK